MTKAITKFFGDYRFLSNFYPCAVKFNGVNYSSVEAAYQASKTLRISERIPFQYMTPGQAKRAGRKLTLREDWDLVKVQIMHNLLYQKFHTSPLKEMLLLTGDQRLVEGNTWGDRFWGVCNGSGENKLGELLMQIRQSLKMSESKEIITMRMMAWEKVKGELQGLLHTYWDGKPEHMGGHPEHKAANEEINRFIKKMDDEIIG